MWDVDSLPGDFTAAPNTMHVATDACISKYQDGAHGLLPIAGGPMAQMLAQLSLSTHSPTQTTTPIQIPVSERDLT